MAIKDIGKFQCRHKRQHKAIQVNICKWCKEKFERPSCWTDPSFCSPWCARRFIQKNYAGKNSKNYKHGLDSKGYKRVGSANNRRLEHRVIMEKVLGRKLERTEWVHHKNGNKLDNDKSNLVLVVADTHFTEVECPHCHNDFRIK